MITSINTNRGGLVRLALYIIVILIILAVLGLNLRGIISSQTFQDNWQFVTGIATNIWDKYLSGVLTYTWEKIILPIIQKQVSKN